MEIKFSVLSYHPSFLTGETINIGILFQHENKGTFTKITKWHRLEVFDDELDIEFAKVFLSGIEDGINNHLFNQTKFSIENFTRFYINEFKFSPIHTLNVNNKEDFIETTRKIYLKYDYDKQDRLKKKEELKYLRELLKSKDVDYSSYGIKGIYNENIKYDYIIGEFGLKLFELSNDNMHTIVNQIKIWAFNSNELKEKYKTIIIYTTSGDSNISDNPYFKSICDIVDKSCIFSIMEFDKCLNFLNIN